MSGRNVEKHAQQRVKRTLEEAIIDVCDLERSGLWLCVDDLVTSGRGVRHIDAWATMHFYPGGPAGRCNEPCCNLLITQRQRDDIAEHLRLDLELPRAPTLEIRLWLNVHDDFRPRQRVPPFA